jgi:hypothetical protein
MVLAAEESQVGASVMKVPSWLVSSARIDTDWRPLAFRAERRADTTSARWEGVTTIPSWPQVGGVPKPWMVKRQRMEGRKVKTNTIGFVHRGYVREDDALGFEVGDDVGEVFRVSVYLAIDDLTSAAIGVTGECWWGGVDESSEDWDTIRGRFLEEVDALRVC